jgi:hypothetical protein
MAMGLSLMLLKRLPLSVEEAVEGAEELSLRLSRTTT